MYQRIWSACLFVTTRVNKYFAISFLLDMHRLNNRKCRERERGVGGGGRDFDTESLLLQTESTTVELNQSN